MKLLMRKIGRRLRGWSPSRYDHLLWLARQRRPKRIMEIGVWRGDRSQWFLGALPSLERYVGLDLFEEMNDATFKTELMGNCFPETAAAVEARLRSKARPGVTVELIKGFTSKTLPELAARKNEWFDFISIDGGHSLETIATDWHWSEKLLSKDGGRCSTTTT